MERLELKGSRTRLGGGTSDSLPIWLLLLLLLQATPCLAATRVLEARVCKVDKWRFETTTGGKTLRKYHKYEVKWMCSQDGLGQV